MCDRRCHRTQLLEGELLHAEWSPSSVNASENIPLMCQGLQLPYAHEHNLNQSPRSWIGFPSRPLANIALSHVVRLEAERPTLLSDILSRWQQPGRDVLLINRNTVTESS